ncbi:MAG TPA: cytochrome P450 [Streptosporangiaceae bacterium]|nr:cytochrome P450 [Streptosporangiaceae bacterium]
MNPVRERSIAVPDFLPPRRGPFNPPDLLGRLRAGDPITKVTLYDGRKAWLVTRYDDVRFVLCDARFSADATNPGLPSLSRGRVFPSARRTMSRMDDPRHADLRRVLAAEFTPARVAALRPTIERIVTTAIDGMLAVDAHPVDFHAAFAVRVPGRLIYELLGVPATDQVMLRGWTRVLTSRVSSFDQLTAADDALYEYCADLVARRMRESADESTGESTRGPADEAPDMIGRLVARGLRPHRGHQPLTHQELSLMVKLLMVTGQDPTANMISLAVLTMLLTPGWFGAIQTSPETVPGAVEELLRFHTLNHIGLPRVATQDVVVGGVTIAAGDGVIVSLASGNRDASVFERPNELDMTRHRAGRHLAFGAGVHRCVARGLARAELCIALRALAVRIPTLQLAVPFADISFMEDTHIYGVRELPVTW